MEPKDPATATILGQLNPPHTLPSSFFEIHLNFILSFIPRSSKWALFTLFNSVLYTCHFSSICAAHTPHLPRFAHPDNILWRLRIVDLLIIHFPPASGHVIIPLGPSILFSNTMKPCSSHNGRDKMSHV